MKKPRVIHPFLFALFPILSVFSHNLGTVPLRETVIPIIIVTSFTLTIWLSLGVVVKDKKKAGIIASLFLLLFFSYEHLFGITCLIMEKVTHTQVLLALGTLFTCAVYLTIYLTIRTRSNLHRLTFFLNLVAAFSVAIPLVRMGAYEIYHVPNLQDTASVEEQIHTRDSGIAVKRPDIYYIILDGYARGDILEDLYKYDNSKFLTHLAEKGFYVATKSKANYCQTYLSLASSLNFIYLDDLVSQMAAGYNNRKPLREMIEHNHVVDFLKKHDYLWVVFSSWEEIKNADIYMTPGPSLSEFQNVLINTTPLALLLDKLLTKSRYDLHREQLLYIFDHLADMTEMHSPLFVFAHILAPHPPFVFGANGEPIDCNRNFTRGDGSHFVESGGNRDEYVESYTRQLAFVNKKISETIDRIVSNSREPPVVILQADHGAGSMLHWEDPDKTNLKERMSILNAYYLPGDGHEQLYEDITPVNTFRVIFNHYFGTEYELLKDESYFSTWSHPYALINVTDKADSDIYTQRSE
jgi:hypothetical protein